MKNGADLWNEEYQKQNIASSFKRTMSHGVEFFLELLPKKILDLGCGNGRNALPLADLGYEVTGIDISETALQRARERLCYEADRTKKRVKLVRGDMGQPLPFKDKVFDVVMDITSFDILIDEAEINCHKNEVARVLKNNGYFLYYDMAEDDPYSLALLAKSPDRNNGIIYTPTGIPFKIYSAQDVAKIFNSFWVVAQEKFKFQDTMDGTRWDRSILCIIMKHKTSL